MIVKLSSQSIFVALFFLGIGALSNAAYAHDYKIGSLKINHPWAIATPDGAKTGAGYMKITNEGTQTDHLIGLKSPAAKSVTLHQSISEGGVAKMRKLDKIEIKPGESVEMRPEGLHIMFEGLHAPLLEASRAQGTLVFEKAGSVDVDFAIVPIGKKPSSHSHYKNK